MRSVADAVQCSPVAFLGKPLQEVRRNLFRYPILLISCSPVFEGGSHVTMATKSRWTLCLWMAVAVTGAASPAVAQTPPTGYVSVFLDRLPNRSATELRARGFAEEKVDAGPHLRLTASGFVEGLLADRGGRVRAPVCAQSVRGRGQQRRCRQRTISMA